MSFLPDTTYDGNHCFENNPDYLDDVFGSSSNGSKMCPQEGGWGCDFTLSDNTCTNNIMGGTADARYFSPKQVQRMHRALSQKSISNYAIAYRFDDSKFIALSDSVTWDFPMKLNTNIRIKSGATLVVMDKLMFDPHVKIVVEPYGKLIVDGGTLTNDNYFHSTWKGYNFLRKEKEERFIKGN